MRVRLRLFAALREALGPEVTRTVRAGTTVGTLWQAVVAEHPRVGRTQVRFAVRERYVEPSHVLHDDDEVACFPPVSGGG